MTLRRLSQLRAVVLSYGDLHEPGVVQRLTNFPGKL